MTQEEINQCMNVLNQVFDKTQEIISLMNTLSEKQLLYVKHLYLMTIEHTKLQELIKEEEK